MGQKLEGALDASLCSLRKEGGELREEMGKGDLHPFSSGLKDGQRSRQEKAI